MLVTAKAREESPSGLAALSDLPAEKITAFSFVWGGRGLLKAQGSNPEGLLPTSAS